MKPLNLLVCLMLCAAQLPASAQCIQDVRYFVGSPFPCFFIGMIATEKPECFDPNTQWTYRWVIRSASDGELIAAYDGFAFSHSFEKFGGYDFCLEIDKDGDPLTAPEVRECVTYTTCEFCKDTEIEVNYLQCPLEHGCDLLLSAQIPAINAHGLKPFANYVITYLPTPQEVAGGILPYDIVFDKVPVTYHPGKNIITVEDNITIPFTRGCYKPKVVFDLEWGAGAHYDYGGASCISVSMEGKRTFRCMGCSGPDGNCQSSEIATEISNETQSCEALSCYYGKEDELDGRSAGEAVGQDYTGVKIFPNPVSDVLFVDITDPLLEGSQLRLTNAIGRVIIQKRVHSTGVLHLDVSSFADGLYLLSITNERTSGTFKKVLVSSQGR